MVKGFKDKDGKFHPTENKSSGVSSSQVITKQDAGNNIDNSELVNKKRLPEGVHLFRIFAFESSEFDADRSETAHFKARNIDDVTDFIKKEFFKKDKEIQDSVEIEDIDEDQSRVSSTEAFDENGNSLTDEEASKLQEEKGDDAVGYVDTGFDIEQDDDIEEDFNTIFGGNDFYDLTKPKGQESGFTSEDAVKQAGGSDKAFFNLGSGQGFESGNKDNDFNLNTDKLDLFDPETNPKPKGKEK